MSSVLKVHLKDGYTVEVIKRYVSEFTRESGIDVQVRVVDEVAAHDTFLDAVGPDGPDLTTVSFWYLREYVENGYLRPLEDVPLQLDLDRYHVAARSALSVDGAMYAVPHTLIGAMLSIHRDLLEQSGRPIPETGDDVLEAARAIAGATEAFGIVARGAPDFPSFGTYAGWAWGHHVRLLDPETQVVDIVEAIGPLVECLRRFGPPCIHETDYVRAGDLMMSGQAGLLFDTSGWGNYLENPRLSQVAGRIEYATPSGPKAPLQFSYAEGLAVTSWSTKLAEAAAFIEWRHRDSNLLREAQDGRFDFPRIDLQQTEPIADLARDRDMSKYLTALQAAWDNIDLDYFPRRPDFTRSSRVVMGAISASLTGDKSMADELKRALDAVRSVDR